MATPPANLLRINGENLELSDSEGTTRWSLPVKSILLIAEYTTDEGPYVDDYFLIFATSEDNQLYFSACSFYSSGTDESLDLLQQSLGSPVEMKLLGSTEWKSRVMWPPGMRENEYFTFRDVPARTLRERIKKRLLGPTIEYAISDRVREFLREEMKARSL